MQVWARLSLVSKFCPFQTFGTLPRVLDFSSNLRAQQIHITKTILIAKAWDSFLQLQAITMTSAARIYKKNFNSYSIM